MSRTVTVFTQALFLPKSFLTVDKIHQLTRPVVWQARISKGADARFRLSGRTLHVEAGRSVETIYFVVFRDEGLPLLIFDAP